MIHHQVHKIAKFDYSILEKTSQPQPKKINFDAMALNLLQVSSHLTNIFASKE